MLSFKSLAMKVYLGYMEGSRARVDLFGEESVMLATSAVCSTSFGQLHQLETRSSRYFLVVPKSSEPGKLVRRKFKAMIRGNEYANKFNSVNLKGAKVKFFPPILVKHEHKDDTLKSQQYYIAVEVINELNKEYYTLDSRNQEMSVFFHCTFQYSLGSFIVNSMYATQIEGGNIGCLIPGVQLVKHGGAKEVAKFFRTHKCCDLCQDLGLISLYLTDEMLSEALEEPVIAKLEEEKMEKPNAKPRRHNRSADIMVHSLPLGTTVEEIEGLLIGLFSFKKITVFKQSAFVWLALPFEAEGIVTEHRFLKFGSTVVELGIPKGKKKF